MEHPDMSIVCQAWLRDECSNGDTCAKTHSVPKGVKKCPTCATVFCTQRCPACSAEFKASHFCKFFFRPDLECRNDTTECRFSHDAVAYMQHFSCQKCDNFACCHTYTPKGRALCRGCYFAARKPVQVCNDVCAFFARGSCKFGDRCRNQHIVTNADGPKSAPSQLCTMCGDAVDPRLRQRFDNDPLCAGCNDAEQRYILRGRR
jgi:hypothetical protein